MHRTPKVSRKRAKRLDFFLAVLEVVAFATAILLALLRYNSIIFTLAITTGALAHALPYILKYRRFEKLLIAYKWVLFSGFLVVLIVPPLIQRLGFLRELTFGGGDKGWQIKAVAQDIKLGEQRYTETVTIRPEIHIAAVTRGTKNRTTTKINLLLAKLYYAEANQLSLGGSTAAQILKIKNLSERLKFYRDSDGADIQFLHDLAWRIEQASEMLDDLSRQGFFARLTALPTSGSPADFSSAIKLLIGVVSQGRASGQMGPLNLVLANLSFATNDKDLVFQFLYAARVYDSEHLPTLDALTYALWKLNADCQSALQYARIGYELAWNQMMAFDGYKSEIQTALRTSSKAQPNLALLFSLRSNEVGTFFSVHAGEIRDYLRDYLRRLQNTAAYCMAYELADESEARRIADELLKSAPDDSDYLDTKGFVLLRFFKSPNELEQAMKLFEKSGTKAEDSAQRDLAEHHRELALKTKQILGL